MTIEARAIIKNIEETKKKIEEIGGVFKNDYAFTDFIFVLKSGKTDLNKEFIRLRVMKKKNWPTKDFILKHKKAKWQGTSKIDNILLKKEFDTENQALDFIEKHFQGKWQKLFEYFREGWEYGLGAKRLFIEDIKGFKPTVEIEAENKEELENIFKELDVTERLSDSVPETMRKIFNK